MKKLGLKFNLKKNALRHLLNGNSVSIMSGHTNDYSPKKLWTFNCFKSIENDISNPQKCGRYLQNESGSRWPLKIHSQLSHSEKFSI